MNKKHIYLIIFFLIIVSSAAFGRIAGNDFINFDDNLYITENSHIQSGFNKENIKWAFTTVHRSYWHPLTWLSHMLDWKLFGANAGGHHLVSLLLHIGAVIFLFLFLIKTTNKIWLSAFAAAFFAVHPLRVESVAWAAERKDVLSMFFGMATLYAYAFYAESSKLSKYIMCLVLFALSLMSKPMMVTLPFVLLLLDYWPLKRWQKTIDEQGKEIFPTVRLVLEKIPFICLTIAVSILALWAQNKVGAMVKMTDIAFTERFSNAIFSYIAYLGKTLWPINLAVFYPFDLSLPLWKVLISAIIFILITSAAFYYIKKLPSLFTGWFWYLGTLVPVIGLVQVGDQAMADRYTYLPSIGIAVGLTWGISALINNEHQRKKILFPLAIAILITLAILTFHQCGYWKNSIILCSHSLHATKNNYKMHHNMGTSFFKEGNLGEAINQLTEAIKINPNYLSYNSRGDIYARVGRYREALDDFNKAISLNIRDADGYYNRALTYDKTGEHKLAIADFNKAISLRNDYVNAYNNRGIVYAKVGQYQQAIEDFTKAISIKPDYTNVYNNRGIIYFSQGKNEQGCSDAKKACELGNCKILETAKMKGSCH